MVCCEVEPSGKATLQKSEIPEVPLPEKPMNKTEALVAEEPVVQEEVLLAPPPPVEIPEIEEMPIPVEEIIDFPTIEASYPGGT